MSDYIGDESAILFIDVLRCNSTTSDVVWRSDDAMNYVLNLEYLNVVTVSSYFDVDDYDTPIKTFLDDFNSMTFFNESLFSYFEMEIQQNQVSYTDDFIAANFYESQRYYSMKNSKFGALNKGYRQDMLGLIRIKLARESEFYERIVYSFFEMFGYLGGLFDFWYFIGFVLVQYFNEKYFKYQLLSSLYQIESDTMSPTTKLLGKKLDISIVPKPKEMSKSSSVKSN